MAKEKGYYNKAGLDVDIIQRDPSKNNIEQVINGDADYGVADSAILLYRANGKPVKIVASIFQHSPLVFISKRSSKIISPFEMKNKTISYERGLDDASLLAVLKQARLDEDDYKYKKSDFTGQDLIDGKVDVMSAYLSDQPYLFKQKGIEVNIINPLNYGIDFYGDNLFTTENEISNHPKRVKAFKEASIEGWKYAIQNVDETISVLKQKYNVKRTIEHLKYEAAVMEDMMVSNVIEIGFTDKNRFYNISKIYERLGKADSEKLAKAVDEIIHEPLNKDNLRSYLYFAFVIIGILIVVSLFFYILNKRLNKLVQIKTNEQSNLFLLFDKGDSVLFRWTNDKNWTINHVSNNVKALLGYTKEEFLEQKITYIDCIYKKDLVKVAKEIEVGLQVKNDFFKHTPYRVVTKSGELKWVLDYTVTDKDINGNTIYFLGYIIDITAEKQYEKQLESQKQKFESIFKYSKDGIAITDLDTNFIDFNDAYLEMTSLTRDELLYTSSLSLTVPEQKDKMKEIIGLVVEKGHVENFEKESIVGNNKRISVNMSISLLPDKKKLLIVIKDITDLKHMENQARLVSMGEMIGNIAHQWRQPLSVISTSASGLKFLAELGKLDINLVRETSDKIVEQSKYLSNTIDDFRNFIKDDKEFSNVNLCDVLNSTLSLVYPVIKNNYITLVKDLSDDIIIYANKNELQQAFINILNNAKDFLVQNIKNDDDRYIFLTTKKIDEETLELTLLDTAGGIEESNSNRIFEPYFTTKHQSVGTGLGLSMVDKIIRERHGFSIKVHNEELIHNGKHYKGACFTLIVSSPEI